MSKKTIQLEDFETLFTELNKTMSTKGQTLAEAAVEMGVTRQTLNNFVTQKKKIGIKLGKTLSVYIGARIYL
jgi:plasmid maintenance system antidote protein VapI